MSFKLYNPDGLLLANCPLPRTRVALTSSTNVFVAPLSMTRIPHGCSILRGLRQGDEDLVDYRTEYPTPILLTMRDSGMGLERGLFVDQGLVKDGPLETLVFNFTEERIRIEKGEVICWLLEL